MVAVRSHWLRPPGPVAAGLRIGLLGGSFNPAHDGHMHVSEVALKRLGLDYVWWLVSPQNPLKSVASMAPLAGRVAQARDVARHPRIVVMDIERALGTRYSVDTLAALQRRFPLVKFVWLMGSDNLQIFRRWRRWPEIVRRVPIAVIQRPGTVLASLQSKAMQRFPRRRVEAGLAFATPPAIAILDGKRNAQSATAIRAAARPGRGLGGRDSAVLNSARHTVESPT
jgi:nicotinate-nucleotide adenylyltransferase